MLNVTSSSVLNFPTEKIEFSWYDYCLFTFMLSLSVVIGIYFGYFGKKQTTASEYLLGGKTMKVFPVAMSLVASNISSIAVLSIPADVYKYGATVIFISISHVVGCIVAAYITVPVFHNLQITSTYEYLKFRFNGKIRIMGSILYNINTMLYLPIVIYGPALALSQVTSINLHLVNPVLCAICIFYTTIGGLKTVIWTDTLQLAAMLGALVAVLCIGVSSVGGLGNVFEHASQSKRLDIDFDIDPTKRDTFWAIVIGWTIFSMPQISINQGSIQKFLSLPTIPDTKKALAIYGFATIFFKSSGILTGLIMYARYHDCDPFTTNAVEKDDQLLPYYVMDVASKIPGLPGLFIAGVFCASLSTLSAHMNSLSGLIYEDFISGFMPEDIGQKRVSNILKFIVIIIGIVAVCLIFVIQHLGGLFALGITLSGVTAGPLLGLFTLGMVFPFANSKGALAGSVASLALTSFIVMKNQIYKASGALSYPPKPLSVESCIANFTNFTMSAMNDKSPMPPEDIFFLFKITHYYNTFIGVLILLLVALPVSWLTRKKDEIVDVELITPLMRWAVPKDFDKDKYNPLGLEELRELNKELQK